jgi:hypothetical protein
VKNDLADGIETVIAAWNWSLSVQPSFHRPFTQNANSRWLIARTVLTSGALKEEFWELISACVLTAVWKRQ